MSLLPNAISKRDLLYGAKNSTHSQTGAKFEAEGWLSDALDFYHKADDSSALLRIQQKAAKEGNAFLVLKAARFLKQSGDPTGTILEVARKSEELGMIRYAISAYERLDNQAKVRELRASVINDGDIVLEDAADVFIPDEPLADS